MRFELRTPALGILGLALSGIPTALLPAPCSAAGTPVEESVPPKVRDAVDRALAWLAGHQNPDGTWPQGASGGTTAVPSLAVMAFLARGHVPGQGPYGELLYHSIDYILDSQREDGALTRARSGNALMYEHGISTVMLSEIYGMVDDPRRARTDKALAASIKLILSAQRAAGKMDRGGPFSGGWRYTPESQDSDISCTGWQLMALRGAANCGAAVPGEALQAGRDYVRRSAAAIGGFSYQPGGPPNQARTATGILAMELLGQHNSPEALAGGDFLRVNPPNRPDIEFYYYAVYYCSQALNQLGGDYWTGVYPKLRDPLLALQQPDGTFPGAGNSQEVDAGPAYRSAMAVLALCVPYRYLPLYQK